MNELQQNLILYALGELEGAEREELEQRLRNDVQLREELDDLRRSLELVAAQPPAEPDGDYWRSFYGRLRPQLQRKTLWQRLGAFLIPDSGLKLATALGTMAVMFVIAGLVLWQFIADHETPAVVHQKTIVIQRTKGFLQHVIGSHLENARLLLQDLENIRSDTPDAKLLIADTRERGERLLSDNRTYLLAAEREKDEKMKALLNDLELVLVEISNMDTETAKYRLPSLKRVIRSKNLLIKIEIINLDQVDEQPRKGAQKEVL